MIIYYSSDSEEKMLRERLRPDEQVGVLLSYWKTRGKGRSGKWVRRRARRKIKK